MIIFATFLNNAARSLHTQYIYFSSLGNTGFYKIIDYFIYLGARATRRSAGGTRTTVIIANVLLHYIRTSRALARACGKKPANKTEHSFPSPLFFLSHSFPHPSVHCSTDRRVNPIQLRVKEREKERITMYKIIENREKKAGSAMR